MKPGDKLYTVYEDVFARGAAKLTIKTAEIVAVGPKIVRISGGGKNRSGLAFSCRSQLAYSELEQYGTSAAEAWTKYVDQCVRLIDRSERELVELRRRYEAAHVRAQVEVER